VGEVELVRVVESSDGLIAAVGELRPDAVLTDIQMPPSYSNEGIIAAKRIRSEYPGTGVVVLSVLDPKVVEGLLARRSTEAASPLSGLTERERQVLEQMATGRSNAALAGRLYLSERAIEKHISSLFQKPNLPPEGDVNRRVAAGAGRSQHQAPGPLPAQQPRAAVGYPRADDHDRAARRGPPPRRRPA
jgi:DNA-binding NarL/FixJ family response regulator